MYEKTEAQAVTEKKLTRQGFRFSHWTTSQDEEKYGTFVMGRNCPRFITEYRWIAPDGSIN